MNKTKLSIIVSLLLSITLIVIILKLTINPSTFEHLSTVNIRYEFFVAAGALNILGWFVWGARLRLMSQSIDKNLKLSLVQTTKIIITSNFLACITPSMAGGEPVRIHLLKKEGMTLGGATAAVIGERLLDAVYVLICIPIALFIFKDYIQLSVIRSGVIIGVIVFMIFVVLFFYAIKFPEKTKAALIWLSNKIKGNKSTKIVKKINREVDNFQHSMVFFSGKEKKSLLKGGILTVMIWSVSFLKPSMILLGLGLSPFFIQSYAAQVLLLVIIMMPTLPGSVGVTEVGLVGLYGMLISASLIGVFVILFRLLTYHMNLIVGAFFQYRIFKSVASFSIGKLGEKK